MNASVLETGQLQQAVAELDLAALAVPDLRGYTPGRKPLRPSHILPRLSLLVLEYLNDDEDAARYPKNIPGYKLPIDPWLDVPSDTPGATIALGYRRSAGELGQIAAVAGVKVVGEDMLLCQLQGWLVKPVNPLVAGIDWRATLVQVWLKIAERAEAERFGIQSSRNHPSSYGIGSFAINNLMEADLQGLETPPGKYYQPPLLDADQFNSFEGAIGGSLLDHAYDAVAIRIGGFVRDDDGDLYTLVTPPANLVSV